jgi:hypothetical protein
MAKPLFFKTRNDTEIDFNLEDEKWNQFFKKNGCRQWHIRFLLRGRFLFMVAEDFWPNHCFLKREMTQKSISIWKMMESADAANGTSVFC